MLGEKVDSMVFEKYPNAEIFKLERVKKIKKTRFVAGALIDAFVDIPDPNDLLNVARNINKHFYLVHDDEHFYIVMVEKGKISFNEIDGNIIDFKSDYKFEYNDYIYVDKGQIR